MESKMFNNYFTNYFSNFKNALTDYYNDPFFPLSEEKWYKKPVVVVDGFFYILLNKKETRDIYND